MDKGASSSAEPPLTTEQPPKLSKNAAKKAARAANKPRGYGGKAKRAAKSAVNGSPGEGTYQGGYKTYTPTAPKPEQVPTGAAGSSASGGGSGIYLLDQLFMGQDKWLGGALGDDGSLPADHSALTTRFLNTR